MPSMRESARIFMNGSPFEIIETFVAFGNAYILCGLLFFYSFFHLALNILAELLRFADRDFYKDWWNSQSLGHFWSLWNLPVHTWCTRHVYYPLLSRGYSKHLAACVVFLLSGLLHEYLCCIAMRILTLFAFIMMFIQAPILIVEQKYASFFKQSQLGNKIFWAIYWFGCNPLTVLYYYYKYIEADIQE